MKGMQNEAPMQKFICMNGYGGQGCDFGELTALGILFWISGGVSIFFAVFSWRKSKFRCPLLDQTVLFWFFMAVWQGYRGVISLFSLAEGIVRYALLYSTINHLLMFIPMCLAILILFDLLFMYRNPGTNAIAFFRALVVLFLIVFTALGVALSFIGLGDDEQADESVALWCACTDLILAIFFALPAQSLLEAATYPMVQPEDVCCVNFCKVGIVLYVMLFVGRTLWTSTHYFHINRLQTMVLQWVDPLGFPDSSARTFNFMYYFLFDFVASLLAMVSVYLFKKHDIMFNENPY
jgi:hypothetical protein